MKLILIALFTVVLVGCGSSARRDFETMYNESEKVFDKQVKTALSNNPVIMKHIGSITVLKSDRNATEQLPGLLDFAFRIEGPKGSGMVCATCVTVDEETENVTAGVLTLDTGEKFNLFP